MNLITWYITNHSTVCSWRGSCSWSLCLRCCPRPRQSARCSWGCPGGCHPPGRSTVQYITVQYSTVQCPGVWHPPGRSVAAPSRGGQHWTLTPVQLFVVTSCLEQSILNFIDHKMDQPTSPWLLHRCMHALHVEGCFYGVGQWEAFQLSRYIVNCLLYLILVIWNINIL